MFYPENGCAGFSALLALTETKPEIQLNKLNYFLQNLKCFSAGNRQFRCW